MEGLNEKETREHQSLIFVLRISLIYAFGFAILICWGFWYLVYLGVLGRVYA